MSLKEIARIAGTSVSTVSRVLNQPDYKCKNPELESRIWAAAQEIRTIDVTDKHIEFCRGCFVCKYNGGHCAIDDDMREILEQMLGSDLLLFSYPLYCYGMPAGLKKSH